MRYLLLVLFLTGCTDQSICNFTRGANAMFGKHVSCDERGFVKTDPLSTCKRKCKDHLNTTLRIGNTTNVYSCSCDNYGE